MNRTCLENKLGGENPAICWGENGADDGGGGGGMPGPIPWLALVTGGEERPGIIELPIEFGDVPLKNECIIVTSYYFL